MNSAENEIKPKRASGKRSKKRKFTGNRFTKKQKQSDFKNEDSGILNQSASQKKLNFTPCTSNMEKDCDFNGYRIIDIDALFPYLKKILCCKVCGGEICLMEEVVCGLSSKISINCLKLFHYM